MEKDLVTKLYQNFRLLYYKNYSKNSKEILSSITNLEKSCLEVIYLLDNPTIKTFAQFMGISQPNATYRIRQLIKKGYIVKNKTDDGREFVLSLTTVSKPIFENLNDYYGYINKCLNENLNDQELEKTLDVVNLLQQKLFEGEN